MSEACHVWPLVAIVTKEENEVSIESLPKVNLQEKNYEQIQQRKLEPVRMVNAVTSKVVPKSKTDPSRKILFSYRA